MGSLVAVELPASSTSRSPVCTLHRTALAHRQKDLVEATWMGKGRRISDLFPNLSPAICWLNPVGPFGKSHHLLEPQRALV